MTPGQATRIYRYIQYRSRPGRNRNGGRVHRTDGIHLFLHLRIPFRVTRSAEFDNIEGMSSFGPACDSRFTDRKYAKYNAFFVIGSQFLNSPRHFKRYCMHKPRPFRKGIYHLPRR